MSTYVASRESPQIVACTQVYSPGDQIARRPTPPEAARVKEQTY